MRKHRAFQRQARSASALRRLNAIQIDEGGLGGSFTIDYIEGMTFSAGNHVPSTVEGQGTAMNFSNAM